ncbi:hypothetical protein COV17_03065 [Candidatus Woesearchaeota archaeon CG10_big_fil_rev_8_21_14_0_10_36_11]|nr:MAG: hypothetical protein COV17_03065 [Candidatus Woesearchaeota archaeon CG10_big_fil_rev_8_21_14_0_10_36_11]
MLREISERNMLDTFCEKFCSIVDKHCNYVVVSGFVAIASGRTRGTEDIDMIIERIDLGKFTKLFRDLLHNNFVCMQSSKTEEVYDYLKENTSVRFTKKGMFLPEMEVKFSKDALDEYQPKFDSLLTISS